MPTIDPIAAAVEAIAAHFEAELGPDGDDVLARVLRGWQEEGDELDLSGKPVLSIAPGGEEREDCSPRSLGSTEAAGVTTYLYRVGDLRFVAQLDLWAAYKAQLDDVIPTLIRACGDSPPRPKILRLTSTGYYNRPLACHLGPPVEDVDGDTAKRGQWRRTFDLRVETDLVEEVVHVPQVQVDLEITTTDGADGASVTETITAFEPA